ncbi:hypothetical protein [Nostoc sp. DSM 114161]|uniref:hypothetical protein n=1 Tax=Nostoc sp. DSM 114161 TaxID=3440143 RepID=UPI0040452816
MFTVNNLKLLFIFWSSLSLAVWGIRQRYPYLGGHPITGRYNIAIAEIFALLSVTILYLGSG